MRVVLIVLVLWSGSGLLLALFMRRRGHNLVAHATLGIGFGPLVALFGLAQRSQPTGPATVISPGGPNPGPGWLDVLVGLDGSSGSIASAGAALEMLGGSVRRLRLASVLDFETARTRDSFDTDERLVVQLRDAATTLDARDAELVLLSGRADDALVEHAKAEGMDLIVVAHRQHPRRSALFGSAVARLARFSDVAVMIGPPVADD